VSALDVTVPCPSCAAPVGFPGRVCPSCKAQVPRPQRDALEARLESADEDFRDGRANIRTAGTILLLLSLLSFALGAGRYLLGTSTGFESGADRLVALVQLAPDAVAGGVFLACFAVARRSPVIAIAAGLLLWTANQVAQTVASPISALPFGLVGFVNAFLRLVVLLLLVRGLVAAIRGRALIRKMTT
jgi:hypothetical protein